MICHSELPQRDWPNLRPKASRLASLLGLPLPPPTRRNRDKEQVREYNKNYRAVNFEKLKSARKIWETKNGAELSEYRRAYYSLRLRYDLGYRILKNLRRRINDALQRGLKSARTLELLGCSIAEFRAHIEALFRPGMTWENYGPVWHIDHIKACAKFDLTDPDQQRECFHWSNQQPLFAEENLKKGSK